MLPNWNALRNKIIFAGQIMTSETTPTERQFADSLPDWAARGFFFVAFLFFGAGKFTSNPNAAWVVSFKQLGFADWFRYLTGVLEVVGAFLVLIPQTVSAGLILLMSTMTGAILAVLIVLHKPSEAFVAFALLCAMISLWMHRRRI